jgi:ADP-heptose:LPS heptosyltransferase
VSNARPRVVVSRSLGLGDLCTAVPALRGLRRAFPHHELVLAAPAWQEPLAKLAGVDRVAPTVELGPLADELDASAVVVNLHGRGPQSTERLLERRPHRLIAFRHPAIAATSAGPEWSTDEHDAARWCRLVRHAGIEARPDELHLAVPDVQPPVAPGAVIVHPGAAAAGRRWPADRFAIVVGELRRAGHRVVLTGSAVEADLCARVATLAPDLPSCPPVISLAGSTDLAQVCALVASARLLVANDTGVAHLASAYRTPSIVLFGPTSPEQWGPPSDGPHRAIWRGRLGDPHADTLDPGLAEITVGDVLEAIREVAAVDA